MGKRSSRTNPVKLFQSVPSTDYGRLMVRYPFQGDAMLAHAYKDAADRLASTFTGDAPDDVMLLPFLTVYRQAFELQLKVLVRYLTQLRRALITARTAATRIPELSSCAFRKTSATTCTSS